MPGFTNSRRKPGGATGVGANDWEAAQAKPQACDQYAADHNMRSEIRTKGEE